MALIRPSLVALDTRRSRRPPRRRGRAGQPSAGGLGDGGVEVGLSRVLPSAETTPPPWPSRLGGVPLGQVPVGDHHREQRCPAGLRRSISRPSSQLVCPAGVKTGIVSVAGSWRRQVGQRRVRSRARPSRWSRRLTTCTFEPVPTSASANVCAACCTFTLSSSIEPDRSMTRLMSVPQLAARLGFTAVVGDVAASTARSGEHGEQDSGEQQHRGGSTKRRAHRGPPYRPTAGAQSSPGRRAMAGPVSRGSSCRVRPTSGQEDQGFPNGQRTDVPSRGRRPSGPFPVARSERRVHALVAEPSSPRRRPPRPAPRNPCARSQPRSRSWSCASVSTPSATTLTPRARARGR